MDIDEIIPHRIFKNHQILKTIFLHIANTNIGYYDINQDLLRLLYVCKTWYKIAAPILYSKIILNNGGITRGVYQGTYTKLETIAKFITNNKKQSEDYYLYHYINKNNEIETPMDVDNDDWSNNNNDLLFLLNLEFTEKEQEIINSYDIQLLEVIKKCISNIDSLRNSSIPLTKDRIEEVQHDNDQLIQFFTDSEPEYLIEYPYDNLFRRLREGISQLKNINLMAALQDKADLNKYNTHTLFIPDLYTNVKMIFFNKTDQFRYVDHLYTYKNAYLDMIGSCKNLEVLSIGSKDDKRHLLMEKDLKELFFHYAFSHLRYLALHNLQYITGEMSFEHLPSNIEALHIDCCKNITMDSIINAIERIGTKLKLLNLKNRTISEILIKAILQHCTNLIYVDISYSKAERNYILKEFQNHVSDIIKSNNNLKYFNIAGILDLKNIKKIEQLFPQVKLYNNENMDQQYNDYIVWHRCLHDLNINLEYQFDEVAMKTTLFKNENKIDK